MTAGKEDAVLLTPGPLTTSAETKAAMLRDWGSRDDDFIALTARVRARLTEIVGATESHSCVLIQGSGTYALEAAVGTFMPRHGKLLVLVNGAYGRRIASICAIMGRACETYETAEDNVPDPNRLDALLAGDASITHVAVVHCETTSGILNPVRKIADVVARHGRRLLIDAMSSFGAIPLDVSKVPCEAIMSSANKCLEGVPGLSFVIAAKESLAAAAGNAPGISLDLHEQWVGFESTGEWRFTPPTHVLAALDKALEQHAAEGGVKGRGARYAENCRSLVAGMRAMGFETYLTDRRQAPIIVTFLPPADPSFDFETLYDALHRRGYVIYPGKLTLADSFRIGCIGSIGGREIDGALMAIGDALSEMGVEDCSPLRA